MPKIKDVDELLHWDDLNVSIQFTTTLGISSAPLDFKIWEIRGRENPDTRLYTYQFQPERPDKPDLEGFVKFDGCSHLWLRDGDNEGYVHLCGIQEWRRFIAVLDRICEYVNTNYGPLKGTWGK